MRQGHLRILIYWDCIWVRPEDVNMLSEEIICFLIAATLYPLEC